MFKILIKKLLINIWDTFDVNWLAQSGEEKC